MQGGVANVNVSVIRAADRARNQCGGMQGMGQAGPGGSYGSGRAQKVSEKLNQSLFL